MPNDQKGIFMMVATPIYTLMDILYTLIWLPILMVQSLINSDEN